jgi:hypothetical protein
MKTKLVQGYGIYTKGVYKSEIDGDEATEYGIWASMIKRCRPDGNLQLRQPAYIGCSVHPDFINFQWFAEWCQSQIGFGLKGWAMDKDILIQGNKVYGPDTCCFVPRELNLMLTHKRKNQGAYPTGVSYHKQSGKYRTQIHTDGKNLCIGSFKTPEEASEAYKVAKLAEIHRQADIYKERIDPRVYAALKAYRFDSK